MINIDVLIVSYGGSCINILIDMLEKIKESCICYVCKGCNKDWFRHFNINFYERGAGKAQGFVYPIEKETKNEPHTVKTALYRGEEEAGADAWLYA